MQLVQKLGYAIVFGLVLATACAGGSADESRLVLPGAVTEADLAAMIPLEALPDAFEETERGPLESESNDGREPPPSLMVTFADGRGGFIFLTVAVEAADAELERHRRSYETTTLAAVTGQQSSFKPGEECDPAAELTDPTVCIWQRAHSPLVGEASAAYENAVSVDGRTHRVYLFVDSGVFGELVVSYAGEESPMDRDFETALLEAFGAGVAELVERLSVLD